MRREGLETETQTLWDQAQLLATKLEPSYEAQREAVLSDGLAHVDETPWRLMDKPGSSRWWVWSVASSQGVFYRLDRSRATEVAKRLLAGFRGSVVADGYEVYRKLAREHPELLLAACWSHARRKFVECEKNYPELSRHAIDAIRELYLIERELAEAKSEVRAQQRRIRSAPIVEALFRWAREQLVLRQSGIGRAIHYLLDQEPGLRVFLSDPRVPLDNNLAERCLRGVVVGRKNHYGSRSVRGTEVAAIFYTLIESAKLLGVEPKHYLLTAAENAIRQPGAITLPRDLIETPIALVG